LKIVLGYIVKGFVELPHPSSPVLSPFDYEHIVLGDYALQPEITPTGVHGDPVFIKPLNASTVYTLIKIDWSAGRRRASRTQRMGWQSLRGPGASA